MSAQDNFVLTDSTYDSFIVGVDGQSEFKMWQGLVGAHYTPYVDGAGNLSWANNGGLPNPPTVNVTGKGLTITGIVAAAEDLPATANQFDTYLVGTAEPYYAYMYYGNAWVNIGAVGKGVKGDQGFSPIVTVTPITGGHQISITDEEDTDTFDVMDGADGQDGVGVPTGGATGQVLAKASGTDYDTEWVNQSAGVDPATANPIMDGTAAVGTSTKYAREDHVHPVYNQIVRPNLLDNWYFAGGGSQQGGGQFPINQRGQTSYSNNWEYTVDRWEMGNGSYPLSVSAIGITSSGVALMQIVNYRDLLGKEVTASAVVNGTCAFATVQIPNQLPAGWTRLITVSVENSIISIDIDASSLMFVFDINSGDVFKAVKLELGDTQTLAHQENGTWVLNEIPDYEEQLIRCSTSIADSGDTYANKIVAYTPKTASLTIAYANWSGSDPYTQTITISGATITSNTKVDLQMDATALAQLIADGVTAMFVSNTSGTLTLYAIGAATTANITVQVTYYETA